MRNPFSNPAQRARVTGIAGRLGVVLLLLAAGLAARVEASPADDLPMLGDASSGLVSPAFERQLGQDFLRQVRAQAPTADDPEMTYYLEQLLYDLAEASALRDTTLYLVVINSGAINAFAAPGGIVGINTGNFLEGRTVHEFSGIVAHELAHLSQRHFARGIEQQRQMSLPALVGLLAGAAIMIAGGGGDAGMAAIAGSQALAIDNQLRYSRAREQEADRLGIETMARADMDPYAVSNMFERMARAYRYSRRPPEFLLTHPVTESRISDARQQASEFPRKVYSDSFDYQLMRTRARLQLADTLTRAEAEFRAEMASDRGNFPQTNRYGLAMALTELGRTREAREVLAPLLKEDPQRLTWILAEARIDIAEGEAGRAVNSLARQLRFSPDHMPLMRAYADALAADRQFAAAQRTLERLAIDRPGDADVWYELAEIAGLAGDILAVHRARAEYFQLHGQLQSALQHLQYALQLAGNNYQMTARLNQRMQDIQAIRQRVAS